MNEIIYIALCDDEKHVHEKIEEVLNKYSKERNCELRGLHFFSAKDLLDSEEEFHILLLDIDMPQMDGIEAAFHLKQQGKKCKIIMLTSKQERFKEAFKIGAYRFVTKPVEINELYEALDDTRYTLIGCQETQLKFNHVPCKVVQRDIDCIEASKDYVKVYIGKKICESDRTLKSWKEELDARLFIGCHKSYIVNLESIQQVKKNFLILENGKEIPVARRRRADMLQTFMEYDTKKH